MVFSPFITVAWQNLARAQVSSRKEAATKARGHWSRTYSLVGWPVAGRGRSDSDNGIAALPTDVSVCTWLSQAGRFIRAVVTSNVERVMMSQVDMIRYCHLIVRMAPRLSVQKEGVHVNDFWCSAHRPSRRHILKKAP